MNNVEERLSEYTRMFGNMIGDKDFFFCWENTDRERDEEDNGGENVPAYFILSIEKWCGGIGDISLIFVYDRMTYGIKLVVEHYANPNIVVYEHKNLFEMTGDDVYNMIQSFNRIAPYFTSIKEIMKLDEDKKIYYKEIERVIDDVFSWEN